jgi:hypothetical protein
VMRKREIIELAMLLTMEAMLVSALLALSF